MFRFLIVTTLISLIMGCSNYHGVSNDGILKSIEACSVNGGLKAIEVRGGVYSYWVATAICNNGYEIQIRDERPK